MSSPLLTVGLAVGCIRRSPGQSLRLFRKARGSQQRRCGNKLSCSGTHLVTSNSHPFAGQLAGLLHPGGELSFVELVVFVDVEVAHVLVLGRSRRERTQRRAAEESHFDVPREAMKAEHPALAVDAIEGR